jgi:hypothetical protein
MATIMTVTAPDVLKLPGLVRLAAPDPAGPIIVATFGGRYETVFTAIDLSGRTLWRRTLEGSAVGPRIGPHGAIWGTSKSGLTAISPDGAAVDSVAPPHDEHERVRAFVLVPGGFCVIWRRADKYGTTARLARHSLAGDAVWSTELPFNELSYPGVVEMSVESGWEPRPMKPWRPRTVNAASQAVLVAGDRVLASLIDDHSGIGACFLVDLVTGDLIATLPPAPYQNKAVVGPGRFLVGCQGYGAFSSALIDRDGQTVQGWPSHTLALVDRDGSIRGPEFENSLPSRSRFRVLRPDGTLSDGPPLADYYTTYPALDAHGSAVFWRDGTLHVIDADLKARALSARTDGSGKAMSRVLLLADGLVVFALGDELLFFRDTGLGPLDSGPWPCGDGNLQGNPCQTPV